MEAPTPPPPPEPPQPPPVAELPPPRPSAHGVLRLLVPALRAALYLIAYAFIQYAEIVLMTALARLAAGDLFRRGGLGSSNEAFLVLTVLTLPPQIAVTWLTLGIGGIWPFVDGILILLGKVPDAEGRALRG